MCVKNHAPWKGTEQLNKWQIRGDTITGKLNTVVFIVALKQIYATNVPHISK